jgi:DNA segregation ATPase FtsK/SpoIIIE-like protein
MKRTKKEPDTEEDDTKQDRNGHADFGHEIWGLVYIAMAVLVLVSLVSHFVNHSANILGAYLGVALASGLIQLFGVLPSFFFPGLIGYIGWQRLRGDQLNPRNLVLSGALMLEICVLLAVPTLPLLGPGKVFPANLVGVSVMQLLRPLFGAHRFGPYFITGLALVVTALLSLRISPQRAAKAMVAAALFVAAFFKKFFAKETVPDETPETVQPSENETADKGAKQRKKEPEVPVVAPAAVKAAETGAKLMDPVEAEQRKRLDEELAAFRAKRHAPIQIMTVETTDVETEDPQLDETALRRAKEAEEGAGDEEKSKEEKKEKKRRATAAGPAVAVAQMVNDTVATMPGPPLKPYEVPPPSILTEPPALTSLIDKEEIERNSAVLEKTLMNFGVEGKVVAVSPGPVVTRYEIVLAPGVKISKVVNLHNDISLAVGGQPIRIEAPIPGKSAVGIELPNTQRQIVYFKHILTSEAFTKSKAKLPVVIGTNISGAPHVADIYKQPHMLIAGQTGSGKSVCINSIIYSLLMTKKPDELRLIMVDPKKVELSFYNGIPHLLSPVVTESKEAVKALHWSVGEMERRYRMLAKVGARNIESFNSRVGSEKFNTELSAEDNKALPFIVILVDELADLMTKASKDVETLVQRIAQLARAVGIHLIVATQRPSVDIITGPIKANLPSRIAFRTIQSNDSRTILDHIGAEKLLGLGDMLFLRNGAPQVERFHGSFISEEDVEKIVSEVRKQEVEIDKIDSFTALMGGDEDAEDGVPGAGAGGARDELFEEAARMIVDTGLGSTSLLQRRLNLGYARAGRLMDQLQEAGFVGPPNGSKARDVIVRPDEVDDMLAMLKQ